MQEQTKFSLINLKKIEILYAANLIQEFRYIWGNGTRLLTIAIESVIFYLFRVSSK